MKNKMKYFHNTHWIIKHTPPAAYFLYIAVEYATGSGSEFTNVF